MHKLVFFNNQIVSNQEVYISGISSNSLYGKGVFTTIAICNSKPFLWEKHWQRLTENAEKLGIDLSEFNEKFAKNALLKLIYQNEVINGRCRLTFLDEKASKIWLHPTERKTSFLITSANLRKTSEIGLIISPFRVNSTSPLVNIKSCNYLENILALEDAGKQGFNEAVRLNEKDEIVSACMANIFWIKDGEIFTPSLKTGCLTGTTRSLVLENFSVYEVKANLMDLRSADSIFLTSSGIGVKRVNRLEAKSFQVSERATEIELFSERYFGK